MSSSQNERTLGVGVLENEQGRTKGEGGGVKTHMKTSTYKSSGQNIKLIVKN